MEFTTKIKRINVKLLVISLISIILFTVSSILNYNHNPFVFYDKYDYDISLTQNIFFLITPNLIIYGFLLTSFGCSITIFINSIRLIIKKEIKFGTIFLSISIFLIFLLLFSIGVVIHFINPR